MQPQDSGDGFNWLHGLSGLGGGALGTLLTWIWRAARIEPHMKLDIAAAKSEMGAKIQEVERRSEEKVEEMAGHFHEYFEGIRRQQDEIKLNMEKEFVRKDDFKEFREEWREAVRDLKQMIANRQ